MGKIPDRWRTVPGWPGYQVSSDGQVRNVVTGRVLRGRPNADGYLRVALGTGVAGGRDEFLVHRLVLLAFRGPCPEGQESCHEDDDPANNTLWNLRWGTKADNAADAKRNGRDVTLPGERNGMAKLKAKDIETVRRAKRGTLGALAKRLGVARSTLTDVRRGRTWRTA